MLIKSESLRIQWNFPESFQKFYIFFKKFGFYYKNELLRFYSKKSFVRIVCDFMLCCERSKNRVRRVYDSKTIGVFKTLHFYCKLTFFRLEGNADIQLIHYDKRHFHEDAFQTKSGSSVTVQMLLLTNHARKNKTIISFFSWPQFLARNWVKKA